MKTVLIGLMPGHRADPRQPLNGPGSGHRLARLSGLTHADYLDAFIRENLFRHTPRTWREWRTARRRAEVLLVSYHKHRIILLGHKVAAAFCFDTRQQFKWYCVGGVWLAWMPHPSGLNHFWNIAENRRRASQFLRKETRKRT